MKINNKGFAITAVLYGLLILFVVLVSSYLMVLSARKNRADNLVKDIENKYLDKFTSNLQENNGSNNSGDEPPVVNNIYTVTLNAGPLASGGTSIIYYSSGENTWYFDLEGTEETRDVVIPTLNNYIFNGYYTLENGSGIQIINNLGRIVNSNISENIELYAYWTKKGGGDISA